jgi:raffinose/stachyose/melibiose transport system permease protein
VTVLATGTSQTPPGPTRPMLTNRPRRRRSGRLGTYAFVVLIAALYVYPLVFLLNTALKTDANFSADPIGITKTFALGNFVTAWNEGQFGSFILNSLLYTVCASTLGTLVALLVAFPVSRGYLRHTKLWYGLFVIMLFLPNALVTQFQLILRLQLYGTRIGYILIMTTAVGVGPLLIAGYTKSIPMELDEAAAIDGAGYLRYLVTFIPHLIKPALATTFILQAIGVWNDIILATILLPNPSTSPITLGLYSFEGVHSNEWGLLAAAAMIVAAPLVAAYIFLQRYLVSGALGGALKG